MIKQLFKTLVAVLAMAAAAAGPAWGQNGNLLTTVTATSLTTYDETTPGVVNVILDGQLEYNNDDGWQAEYRNGYQGSVTVTATPGFSIDSCKFYVYFFSSYQDSYTVTAAPFAVYPYCVGSNQKVYPQPNAQGNEVGYFGGVKRIEVYGTALPPTPHTVRMAAGTEDAANWTVTPAEALTTGVLAGTPITVTYVGDLKVKEIIATKHLEPNEVPLTIEALTAGTVVVQHPQSGMKYTLNGGTKTAVSGNINVAAGDKVAFYGNGTSITSYFGTTIGGTAEVKAYGNIMSLVNENGFATATTLTANDAFSNLFGDYANLKDISGLLLPATTLTESCYEIMFNGCTGLTTVPSDLLPATTMAKNCYTAMFAGCVNLTNVPTLPATTLAELCYNNMFLACNGLTTVPTGLLPATTLAIGCYSYMFLNCSNLTTAPALPATTLAERCYSNMFCNCTALTTVPSDLLPATTLAEKCYQQMFYGCEKLAASPVLPATTLVSYCYQQMFYDCSNLSSVTCLATSGINQNSSTEYWLDRAGDHVQGTKIFNAASSANWPMDNESGIPSGWTLMTPALSITSPSVGQVIGSDGKNYAYGSLPTGVTKVALIAYVNGSNGLAIALADESGYMNWATAKSTCEAKTPAFTGGTWKLPSEDDWKNMLTYDGVSYTKTNLQTALSNAGGYSFQEWICYWSSTDYIINPTEARDVTFQGDEANFSSHSKTESSGKAVRACLAFTVEQSAKPAATVTTAPTATAAIIEANSTSALVNAGAANGGSMMYAVTTTNAQPASTADFSATIPTAQGRTAGTYYVWYYAKADAEHSDSEIAGPVSVTLPVMTTVTWNSTNVFNSAHEHDNLNRWNPDPLTYEGITISVSGESTSTFTACDHLAQTGTLSCFGDEGDSFTFTAPQGKLFCKIEIIDNGGIVFTNYGDWTTPADNKIVWSGTAASTVTLGTVYAVANHLNSIVFKLIDAQ